MAQSDGNGVTILMAEDDDGHARLVQERFESVGVRNRLIRFKDGTETWKFISGGGLEPGKSYLLLLDIRMPGPDGVEILKRVKTDPQLKNIPIIMLTTTDDPKEIAACYELGCNSYLTKPVEFEKFAEVIRRLGLFLTIMRVDTVR